MRVIKAIVYRYLTDADFFNINKPAGAEEGGGGQTYIDFSTRDVPLANWRVFLDDIPGVSQSLRAVGPSWKLQIGNIGIIEGRQYVEIYQRRSASVAIARQKIGTRGSNRLYAWHPKNKFPKPIDPTIRHQCPDGLAIFLVKCDDKTIWAGWFINDGLSTQPYAHDDVGAVLKSMLRSPGNAVPRAGMLFFDKDTLTLDETNPNTPFLTTRRPGELIVHSGRAISAHDVDSDLSVSILFDEDIDATSEPSYSIARVRQRNIKAARELKCLYQHHCQITGTEFLFLKKDGTFYTEVHHLIPLGKGGADNPRNMVVLSPQLHKMFHHADVKPIDLSKLRRDHNGIWYLDIIINGKEYKLRWHPSHARIVRGIA